MTVGRMDHQDSGGSTAGACATDAASHVAVDCSVYLRDAFNTSIKKSGAANSEQYRFWQCSSNFKSHDAAINSGLDVGTVVYGVPLQVGGTFDPKYVDKWKHEHCSDEQRSTINTTATFEFVRRFEPALAAVAAKCLGVVEATQISRALFCELTGSGKTPVFSARWRRTDGDTVPPKVRRATIVGGTCTPAFKAKEAH